MAQNYLYMLEFAVQELVITQGNECAPPEYPLNAEFTFRTGVYVSIPEDDFGSIKDESNLDKYACPPPPKPKVDDGRNKNAQCCLFALEKPVGDDENLMVHVYKKRTEKCKFLIGCTEHRMKEMFDKVMSKYYLTNSNGKSNGKKNGDKKNGNGRNGDKKNGNGRNGNGSDKKNGAPGGKRLSAGQDDEPAGEAPAEDAAAPAEDAVPAEDAAAAPAEVQAVPADAPAEEAPKAQPAPTEKPNSDSAVGGAEAGAGGDGEKVEKPKAKSRSDITVAGGKLDPTHKHVDAPKRDVPVSEVRKMGLPLYNMEGKVTGSMVLLIRLSCMGTTVCTSIPYPEQPSVCGPAAKPVCDPLCRPPGTKVCAETCISRVRPCDMMGEDVCPESEKDSLSVSSSFADSAEDESIESIPVIRPKVDRTAYDEFEADLNGCGLAIRVLKNAHKVSAVRRYEDPSSCNQCKSGTDQKTAVSKLLQLVCRVLLSLNSEQGQNASPCQPSNNAKAPTLQQICQCIQQMLGPPDAANKECGRGSTKQYNRTQSLRRDKNKIDPCKNRSRGGCECNPQRDIMLFLESIRQVVANKKGLSDLANLLMQCTCGDGSDGDNKSGFASILKIILEKIKKCADDKPSMEKQMDLCSLVRTLTEIQNTRNSTRIRAGDNRSCSSESERSSLQTSENISCLVKKILELGVKYCSNKNINLRNVLCKILSDDVCNEELSNICRTIGQYLESDRNVVCDHVRKETAGRTVNAPCLPTVRGNIKYPSNMDYGTGSFSLPLPQDCDEGNVDQYRRKFKQRECCVQIDGPDIDNTMQGINQKLPTGIEICRKGTMDLDSDVFILKMGKKAEASGKKGLIEIELRTPKGPSGGRPQLASIATQVDEDMLKERVTSTGGGGDKPKGKGKGKGKGGKGKGKKGKK